MAGSSSSQDLKRPEANKGDGKGPEANKGDGKSRKRLERGHDKEKPLLKKRRLGDGLRDGQRPPGDGWLLRDALLGNETAQQPTFPSPRAPARRPQKAIPIAAVSTRAGDRDGSSKQLFFLSQPTPADVSRVSKPPPVSLATCHTAYCATCVGNFPSTKLDHLLGDLKALDNAVFHHRLHLAQSRCHSPRGIATFYAHAGCSSPLLRCQIVGFMVHCQRKLPSPLSPNTFYLGLSIFDRFILKNIHNPEVRASFPKIAGAALILASKMEDVWCLHVDDLTLSGGQQFSSKEILYWEVRVLQSLDFDLSWPTAYFFLTEFLRSALELANHYKALNKPGSVCRCYRCHECGQETEFDCAPFEYLKSLGAADWNPSFREGRGCLAIHACALYVLDILLCHPESVRLTPSCVACTALVLAIEVLNKQRDYHTISLLPPVAREIALKENFVETLANAFGVTDEHALAVQAVRSTGGDAHLQEALSEPDPKERQIKYTVYLMLKANREGRVLTAMDARTQALQWMEQQSDDQENKPPTHLVVTEQKPTQSEHLLPLGKFALDIYAKHRDAAGLFLPAFREWIDERRQQASSHLCGADQFDLDELYETQGGSVRSRTRAKSVVPHSPIQVKKSVRKRRQSCPPIHPNLEEGFKLDTSKTPIYLGTKPVKKLRVSLDSSEEQNTGSTMASASRSLTVI